MSKAIVRRIEKIEQPTITRKLRVVTHEEFNGVYNIEQKKLSKQEFEEWKSKLDKETELIIIEIVCHSRNTNRCDAACSFSHCEVRKDRLSKPDGKCGEAGEHDD